MCVDPPSNSQAGDLRGWTFKARRTTMRLLRFEGKDEDNIDEVLMTVPDDYDKALALKEASDYIGDCHIVNDVELFDITNAETSGLSDYRVYVG